jgi:hypothetical protein
MYSKFRKLATLAAAAILLAACSSMVPWRNEPVGQEINLAFVLRNNLLFLPSARLNGHPGRFFFASAAPRTIVDPGFAAVLGTPRKYALQIGEKDSLPLAPAVLDLGGTGDAMLGADVGGNKALTIDYASGLVTYQKEGIHPELMTLFRYQGEPAIDVRVDGALLRAVVDTSSPDTLVLPRGDGGRGHANVAIAGTNFGSVDVRFANVQRARVGNRLLSKFLITIDYGKHEVGLWRDPRIAM